MTTNFLQFVSLLAEEKRLAGHVKTANNYLSAVRAYGRFLVIAGQKHGPTLRQLSHTHIISYENWLRNEKGVCRNTTSFYLRPLRAAYNEAVRRGLCKDQQPFRMSYMGVDATRKRAADPAPLNDLFLADLSLQPSLAFARDLFMFSFLGHGIAFIDLARMKLQHVFGRHLHYARSKTGQPVSVCLSEQMSAIIHRWHVSQSPFLLPIVGESFTWAAYDSALHRYNRNLHKLAVHCHLNINLTSYTARHSWASEAYRLAVPMSVISTCMGHTTEATTRIYLRSLDTDYIDRQAAAVEDYYFRRGKS